MTMADRLLGKAELMGSGVLGTRMEDDYVTMGPSDAEELTEVLRAAAGMLARDRRDDGFLQLSFYRPVKLSYDWKTR